MAVEVLVRNYDAPGGRKRGDIVSVKKSPAQWGLCEGSPKYTILKIEDADITAVTDYYGLYQRHAALLWDATGLAGQLIADLALSGAIAGQSGASAALGLGFFFRHAKSSLRWTGTGK